VLLVVLVDEIAEMRLRPPALADLLQPPDQLGPLQKRSLASPAWAAAFASPDTKAPCFT
jgi:hypothetical protein